MKVKKSDLNDKQLVETLDTLYTATSSLKGRDAMKRFLRDLLTESERIMLGRRLIIARRILAGEGYEAIALDLKVGKTTIAKVDRWLSDQVPGYEEAISGMTRKYKKRSTQNESRQLFAALKRKYPLHFFLFPWPKGYKPKGW